jgi:glutathione S-transferase
MALTLYMHPLSSYCHKALIALYENAIDFTPQVVNLGDPAERDNFRLAAQVRATDRFYDLHLHDPLQKIVGDKLRPADGHDPIGVSDAKERMGTALRFADREMATRHWAVGDLFSMADCGAAAPLFFINKVLPLAQEFPHVSAHLERLMKRPSYARALVEAQPYMHFFPG